MKFRGHHQGDKSSLNQGPADDVDLEVAQPAGQLNHRSAQQVDLNAEGLEIEPQVSVMPGLELKVPSSSRQEFYQILGWEQGILHAQQDTTDVAGGNSA